MWTHPMGCMNIIIPKKDGPFDLYKYCRLPMGITNSPDFFQSVMHPVFAEFSRVECFVDDISIFTLSSFHDNILQLCHVILRLERDGFTVNPLKCEWAAKNTEYAGFLLKPEGIKPMPNNV